MTRGPMRRLAALLFLLPMLPMLPGCPTPTLGEVQEEVFTLSCAFSSCHGNAREGELGLTDSAVSWAELVDVESFEIPGETRVIPGDSENSLLYMVLDADVGAVRQMPVDSSVTPRQKALVAAWIDGGALDD